MQRLIEQLERASQRARLALWVLRGSSWLNAVLGTAIGACLIDFLLRLPPWMRLGGLIIGVMLVAVTAYQRLGQLTRFRPTLTTLALRLERMLPQTHGRLASAVAFATRAPGPDETDLSRAMAERSIEKAQGLVQPEQIASLVELSGLWRHLTLMVVLLGVIGTTAMASPATLSTAVLRWVSPYGDAAWPSRHVLVSDTEIQIAPDNAPLRLAARVTRGDHAALRTWVVYRFESPGKTAVWKRALMTRQADAGLYLRLLEPDPGSEQVRFYFEAGDGQTLEQVVRLIPPPTLQALDLEIAPPAYAQAFVPVRQVALLEPGRQAVTVEALAGSRLSLRVAVTGSFAFWPEETSESIRTWVEQTFAGLLQDPKVDLDLAAQRHEDKTAGSHQAAFTVQWTLHHTATVQFRLPDEHGQRYDDPRRFRFEAREDRLPSVTILEPATDRSVLPMATVELLAEAQDDVAAVHLELAAQRSAEAPAKALKATELASPRPSLSHALDLSPLELKPGDELLITARVQDGYSLAGKVHEPVTSAPRRLRIIDTTELVRQIRLDLAQVRQRAERARHAQRSLLQRPAVAEASGPQRDIAQRLRDMGRTLEDVAKRVKDNKLEDEWVNRTLEQSGELTQTASDSAEKAAGELSKPERAEASRQQQNKTEQELDRLVRLLDQGSDAFELQQQLSKIAREQKEISDAVRQMLPRTAGQRLEDLPEEAKGQLDQNAQRQKELSERVQELTRRMRSTAAAIDRQSKRPEEQAVAEAMRQAAETATREELDRKMEEAAQQTEQNQLSGAQQNQAQSEQTLQRMLEQLDRTERLRREMLHRRLLELADAIRKLRDQQKAQLDRLIAAVAIDGLDTPLVMLRRNTLVVVDQARAAGEKAEPIAVKLDDAAVAQSDSVVALRVPAAEEARVAERRALESLEEALKLAEALANEAGDDLGMEDRLKLIEAYARALAEQRALQALTRDLVETVEADRNRVWRAGAVKLGDRQADLRVILTQLREKVAQTVVYDSMHGAMDRWSGDASTALRRAKPDARTPYWQQRVAVSLEALIEAMKQEKSDQAFNEDPAEAGGGGGGAQGRSRR